MKYIAALLFVAFICPFISRAQSNFKPAFAITIYGDTLRGLIDFREWSTPPRHIKFKADESSPIKQLTPATIKHFNVSGLELYYRYEGKISLDRIDESHPLLERDSTFRMDTVFVKLIQKGKFINIYSYSDRIKNRLYYTEKDGDNPQELAYRLYQDQNVVTMHKGRTVNEFNYMKQLYDLAIKFDVMTEDLQRMIEYSRYDKSYILRIARKINGQKNNGL